MARGEAPMSAATQRAYRADWAHFAAWCLGRGREPIPAAPETVAAYLQSMRRSRAPSTVRRRLAALGCMHRFNGAEWDPGHPLIRAALQEPRRGTRRGVRHAAAIGLEQLRRLVSGCEDGPAGRRDRAMLLLAYAGALRRSELVALHVEDAEPTPTGLRLRLRGAAPAAGEGAAGEGAGEAEGVTLEIPRGADPATCPVRALEGWRAVLVHRAGPLFRRVTAGGRVGRDALWPDAVRRILLRRAAQAGLSDVEGLTAHGLRAGFLAEAHRRGEPEELIMRHSRHRDRRTLRGYGPDGAGTAVGEGR